MTPPKAKFAVLALIAVVCVGFTLGLTVPAWAGFDEGMAAYNRGDYATALREWRKAAEQGNAYAQTSLGVMYHNGQGVTQDYVQAHMWFNLAANFVKLRRDKAEAERRRAKELESKRRAKKLKKKRRVAEAEKRRAKELERKRLAAEAEKRRAKELEIFRNRARQACE